MNLFYFEGEFIEEDIFPFLDKFSSRAQEENMIYFSSSGGNPNVAYVFADSLWRIAKEGVIINILFYDEVHSATFLFLHNICKIGQKRKQSNLRTQGEEIKLFFLEDAFGALHTVTHGYDSEEQKEDFILETEKVRKLNVTLLKHYSKKMTREQRESFKKNKEAFFDSYGLQKLFGGTVIKQFE